MITSFDDFCTWAFVLIDDLYKPLKPLLKHSGPHSECSDSEVITLAIVGECKGWNQETELLSEWSNYPHLFPVLPERSRFNRRRRNLMGAINVMLHHFHGVYKAEKKDCILITKGKIMGSKYPQKLYTAEFKREAVRLLETSGKSGALIAQELGISDGSLYTWRKQFAEQGEEAFPGKGHQTPVEEELRQLRAENERLRQERDILKKAIAIFSHPPGQR
jgi:transposase